MDNDSRKRLQLGAGFALFAAAVAVSYFSISDDGPPAEQDVLLLMDVSGSMADGSKIGFAKQAASELVDALGAGNGTDYRIGLVTFSDRITLVTGLTGDGEAVKAGIQGLRADGGTAMGDGIHEAAGLLRGGSADRVRSIVLLSDGMATAGMHPLVGTLAAQTGGIRVFSVGYGEDADVYTLRTVASATGGEYFAASTGQDLARAFGKIADLLISPVSHYSSRAMMLATIPILLFIPAIEVGITTMMARSDAPAQRNASSRPCPHCGHANRKSSKFCLKCGKPVAGAGDEPVRRNASSRPCPHCGHANRKGGKFCLKCGRQMGGGGA